MPGPVAAPGPHLKYITDTLTDQLWKRLEPLTPTPARRYRFPGRRRVDNRAALEGILFVVRTGTGWNDLPTTAFGSPARPAGGG
jgi:transposase